MPGTEELRAAVADFRADLNGLLSGIEEAANENTSAWEVTEPWARTTSDGRDNPYYEDVGQLSTPGGNPELYEYTAYRSDIATLIEAFNQFIAEAHPSKFDTINKRLKDVHDRLAEAIEFNWNDISDALSGWTGGAAANFRNVVITPFAGRLLRQANLAKEAATGALAYQAIIVHTRADILDLAHQLKGKVEGAGGAAGLGFEDALFVVGAVAAGAALVTGGPVTWPAVISFAVSTTGGLMEAVDRANARDYALNGINAVSGGERAGNRTIRGSTAAEFIPSTLEIIEKVIDKATAEEEKIRDGFKRDFEVIGPASELPLEVPEPDLTSVDTLAGLGVPPDLTISDIVKLKKVGTHDLPAVAEILNKAHEKVETLAELLHAGIGSQVYVGTWRVYFYQATHLLDTALTKTRDYLYQSGRNLAAVADGYYATEEESRLALAAQLQQEGITLQEHIEASDYPPGVTPENIGFDDVYREETQDFPYDRYEP
jgi:hypothetical protein